jgi:FMN phosphatase YigB (HAD superfamily)
MITTILCDIGNVLIGFDHHPIWQRLAAMSPLSAGEIGQRLKASTLLDLHETGKLSSQDFFREIQTLGHLDPALSFEEFCLIWTDIFWENKPMIQLAQTLRQQYALFLVSNVGEIHWDWLVQHYPIFSQVAEPILSFQVGYMKPAKEIYQEALLRAGALPEQCVYIDDVAEYIAASRELGIQGFQYQSLTQVKNALKMLTVDC